MLVNAVPDVVLVDHRLPDGDAVAAVTELHALQPRARFLVLTTGTAEEVLVRAIEAGACGFVEKTQSLSALCAAVRVALAGDTVVPRHLLQRLLLLMARRPELRPPALVTERDHDLLVLIAEGKTNAEIAERVAVDVSVVQQQVAALSATLGAHSKLQLLSIACRQGLLPRTSQ